MNLCGITLGCAALMRPSTLLGIGHFGSHPRFSQGTATSCPIRPGSLAITLSSDIHTSFSSLNMTSFKYSAEVLVEVHEELRGLSKGADDLVRSYKQYRGNVPNALADAMCDAQAWRLEVPRFRC
jgi:hypothetical protein